MQDVTDIYSGFAAVYDELMKNDIDYDGLCDMIERLFRENGKGVDLIADLACGTGAVTSRLAKRGYDMTGIDASVEMLDLARKKDEKSLYLNQDITEFELYGTMDAILCMTDGFNYITEEDSLRQCFFLANNYLNPGGLFLFDMSSPYKLSQLLGNNTFVYDDGSVFYTWENTYEEDDALSISDITFFLKDKNVYRRADEEHIQRAWEEKSVCSFLKEAGFSRIRTFSDLNGSPVKLSSERIYYCCEKI